MSEDVFKQKDRFFGVGQFVDPYPKLSEPRSTGLGMRTAAHIPVVFTPA